MNEFAFMESVPVNPVVPPKKIGVDEYNRIYQEYGGIVTPTVAAELAGLSRQRVYQLAWAGELRFVKVGDRRYIALREVRQRIERKKGLDKN